MARLLTGEHQSDRRSTQLPKLTPNRSFFLILLLASQLPMVILVAIFHTKVYGIWERYTNPIISSKFDLRSYLSQSKINFTGNMDVEGGFSASDSALNDDKDLVKLVDAKVRGASLNQAQSTGGEKKEVKATSLGEEGEEKKGGMEIQLLGSGGEVNDDNFKWGTPLREAEGGLSCEAWLEEKDRGPDGGRDFAKQPVFVLSREISSWPNCAVPCQFVESLPGRLPSGPGPLSADASFDGMFDTSGSPRVVRSMESATNYPSISVQSAKRQGVGVLMTTDLSSDVPAGYFSWAEYDLMADLPEEKPEMAAAFISNCNAVNHRLEVLQRLHDLGVAVHSFGACQHNRDESGRGKIKDLAPYKFYLAFENSNEDDYVTEKFFQSLVAGAIPVVMGAPNIAEFAPADGTVLHIASVDDVPAVAATMLAVAKNATALAHMMRWKREGPSDQFLALIDMGAVHSSCRLCIHLATRVRSMEFAAAAADMARRPCRCAQQGSVLYHLFVRERGRFDGESVFLRSADLTVEGLHRRIWEVFHGKGHMPIWEGERPEKLKRKGEFKVYRVYPVGSTQRAALYGDTSFSSNAQLVEFLRANPCPRLEAVFV